MPSETCSRLLILIKGRCRCAQTFESVCLNLDSDGNDHPRRLLKGKSIKASGGHASSTTLTSPLTRFIQSSCHKTVQGIYSAALFFAYPTRSKGPLFPDLVSAFSSDRQYIVIWQLPPLLPPSRKNRPRNGKISFSVRRLGSRICRRTRHGQRR